MSDVAIPQLNPEQKNRILFLQRQLLQLHIQREKITGQLQATDQALVSLVNGMASELSVDSNEFQFDLDTLSFHPRQAQQMQQLAPAEEIDRPQQE